jgi:hypothetical protein
LQETTVWMPGTATNLGLLAAIGVLRLLAALVAQDDRTKEFFIPTGGPQARMTLAMDTSKSSALTNNPGFSPGNTEY